ncbi:MAG: hypothetical protein C4576_21745 [Desulfobacteraceae bacterium]|nr:MAG: hypothetical protein C4576_21745 [Desulfobacteraceae bacterium]
MFPKFDHERDYMKKVLLTTVQKPFGIENEHVLAELFHGQVTRSQGIFSFRSVYSGWGLEFIANNLRTPVKVLHYPSEKDFVRELKEGYDYVGINFVIVTWSKARRLIELVRRESPSTKVILGGYGTVLSEVDAWADHVCRGEGLEFMQRLLGEKPVERYKPPIVVNKMKCISLPVGHTGVLFAGLGCPNGCDFCCTSHFFKMKHLPLLRTGKEIYQAMKAYDGVLKSGTYSIIDEDFLKDKKRIEELYQYTSRDLERPRSFSCFASAKSIRQYDPEWLVELGLDSVWIGVESNLYQHQKVRDCNKQELFDSLHQVGINTLASMILGIDQHCQENIWEDIDSFLSLKPTLSQFLIYSPCPTTPLWKRLEGEGRLIEDYPLEDRDGFHLLFRHENFSAEEIERVQENAFQKEYRELGPSVMRYVEKALNGYRHFAASEKPIHVARRQVFKKMIARALPLFGTVVRNAPSAQVKQWAVDLKKEVLSVLGVKERFFGRAKAALLPFSAAYTRFSLNHTTGHLQPKTRVNAYNFAKTRKHASPVLNPLPEGVTVK